jgi:hypothetical protein
LLHPRGGEAAEKGRKLDVRPPSLSLGRRGLTRFPLGRASGDDLNYSSEGPGGSGSITIATTRSLRWRLSFERIALSDDYFVEKRLCPNLDFYSAITLKALGFPTEMFTVLYAIARTAGWIAHWKEMIESRPH